jgi:glucose/arabinose dehydrogenase
MRTFRVLTAATCLLSIALAGAPVARARLPAAPPSTVTPSAVALKVVAVKEGLNGPSGFTFSPSGRIWYLEKISGEIRILNRRTKHERLFFDIRGVNGDGERGALGIALDPDWPATPFVYVYVTRMDHGALVNELLRIRSVDGTGSGFDVLFRWKVRTSAVYHNGGRILFGPDGKLYIVTGENDDPTNSQEKTNLRGKILRIDPDGSIPASNPFGSRIWSFGHRNSFGFTFDPKTGRLWETENGPSCNDEINLIVKGGNYGWGRQQDCSTGVEPENTNNSGPAPRHLPKTYFGDTIGITGAAFCVSCGLGSALAGDLIFGDVNTSSIRAIDLNATRTGFSAASRVVRTTSTDGVHSVEVGPKHRIYFSGPTGIYRLALA